MENKIYFVLGTKSEIKIKALKEALFEIYNLEQEIVCYNVSSGVPEQPFGEEGFLGAFNRATNAANEFEIKNKDKNGYAIGIENFLDTQKINEENSIYLDIAAVTILKLPLNSNIKVTHFSEPIIFENSLVEEAKKKGTTVGIIMKNKGLVKDSNNPHLDLVGKSRTIFLKETLILALKAILQLN